MTVLSSGLRTEVFQSCFLKYVQCLIETHTWWVAKAKRPKGPYNIGWPLRTEMAARLFWSHKSLTHSIKKQPEFKYRGLNGEPRRKSLFTFEQPEVMQPTHWPALPFGLRICFDSKYSMKQKHRQPNPIMISKNNNYSCDHDYNDALTVRRRKRLKKSF